MRILCCATENIWGKAGAHFVLQRYMKKELRIHKLLIFNNLQIKKCILFVRIWILLYLYCSDLEVRIFKSWVQA